MLNIFLNCLYLSYENYVNISIDSGLEFDESNECKINILRSNKTTLLLEFIDVLISAEDKFVKFYNDISNKYEIILFNSNPGSAVTVLNEQFLRKQKVRIVSIQIEATQNHLNNPHLHYNNYGEDKHKNRVEFKEITGNTFIDDLLNYNQILCQFVYFGQIKSIVCDWKSFFNENVKLTNDEMLKFIKENYLYYYEDFIIYLKNQNNNCYLKNIELK